MHTLLSDGVLFDDSEESHETITNNAKSSLDLVKENADTELYQKFYNVVVELYQKSQEECAHGLMQIMIERPVYARTSDDQIKLVCMVGVYVSDCSNPRDNGEESLGMLYHSVALELDPEIRQFVDMRAVTRTPGEHVGFQIH